jgi:hypothetical protein
VCQAGGLPSSRSGNRDAWNWELVHKMARQIRRGTLHGLLSLVGGLACLRDGEPARPPFGEDPSHRLACIGDFTHSNRLVLSTNTGCQGGSRECDPSGLCFNRLRPAFSLKRRFFCLGWPRTLNISSWFMLLRFHPFPFEFHCNQLMY